MGPLASPRRIKTVEVFVADAQAKVRAGGERIGNRGSPLIAWCGGPGADHGRKHEPGGRMVIRGA